MTTKSETREIVPLRPEFTRDQIDLMKRTVAKGATDDELQMFLYQANKTGLDPLARQIHFVKRADHSTIQTGIDGYRLIAERTGRYAGNSNPTFEWEHDEAKCEHPVSATVTITKIIGTNADGSPALGEFTATADWGFFYPGEKQGFMWRKGKGKFMLAKCAEALALRKAFPAELSGVYTDDEMHQAGEAAASSAPPAGKPIGTIPAPAAKPTPAGKPAPAANPTPQPAGEWALGFNPRDIDDATVLAWWAKLERFFRETQGFDLTRRYPVLSTSGKPLSIEYILKLANHGRVNEVRSQMIACLKQEKFREYRHWEENPITEEDARDVLQPEAAGDEPPPMGDDDLPF